jgi:agmatinase
MTFDPEGTFSKDSSVFGMPKGMDSKLKLLPVCWEPTTSFMKGTVNGPEAIFKATKQMDLYHPYFRKIYEHGISWDQNLSDQTLDLNQQTSSAAERVISAIEENVEVNEADLSLVNQMSEDLNRLVYEASTKIIDQNMTPGLVGGDHSCPFGLIQKLSEVHSGDFSIVHIDAHFDFRNEYQGFRHSHASIIHNVKSKITSPPDIYQIGIRDFSESELKFAEKNSTFILDQELQNELLCGKTFETCLEKLFKNTNKNIYISFDIDGLSPEFCPSTGTPVPGGLTYSQAVFLIQFLHRKGHSLIGFDLVEVSPSEAELGEGLDEVIAARILYELSCFALASH